MVFEPILNFVSGFVDFLCDELVFFGFGVWVLFKFNHIREKEIKTIPV